MHKSKRQTITIPGDSPALISEIDTPLYWIAINGGSCAASIVPSLNNPIVIPTPEWLAGFPTRLEAAETQHFLLTAPIDDVGKRLIEMHKRNDIRIVPCKTPQPPTHGQTIWVF
jgi:hypothetical protein